MSKSCFAPSTNLGAVVGSHIRQLRKVVPDIFGPPFSTCASVKIMMIFCKLEISPSSRLQLASAGNTEPGVKPCS